MNRRPLVPILGLFFIVGCGGTTVQLSVLRPAQLNAAEHGGTMSIGEFRVSDPNWYQAGTLIAQDLRQRVVGVEGGVVRFMESGGGLIIHGQLLDHTYAERVTTQAATCSRTEGTGQAARTVNYPCTEYTRTGQSHVNIIFNVSTSGGQAVTATTFEDNSTSSTTARDQQPAAIDGDGMLRALREGLTERFAHVILPWRETVAVHFQDCEAGAEALCERGVQLVQGGDYPNAVGAFEQAASAIDNSTSTVAPADRASPHWNRALALEYSGRYPEAIMAFGRAIELDPGESDYREELANVQRMQSDAERLRQQGLGTSQAEDVQSAAAQ